MSNAPLNLDNIRVEKEFIKKVIRNIEYNEIIYDYYTQMSEEYIGMTELINGKRDRLESCNKLWKLDVYELQKIKDFKRTNLCRDKFCANCKKVKQASRMSRFIPYIEPYKENLYLLTLTVPNCLGKDIKATVKTLFKAYFTLNEYLKGHKHIKGIDFSRFGYKGSVRSLEVTFTSNSYHPHLHAGLVLDGYKQGKRTIKNTYSYDYRGNKPLLKHVFREDEILIQKIWYLLINGIKVTKDSIDNLEVGYSCTLDKFHDDDFGELFKYMTKETTEDGKILSYQNFIDLYFSLFKVRQIQGYGCLYNIKDEDISEEVDEIYNSILEQLNKKESSLLDYQSPKELLRDNEYLLISRKRIFTQLKKL